jgi:hypothetical protein
MRLYLSLFHCDSEGGNRAYEDLFQRWLFVSKEGEILSLVGQPDLAGMIDSAKHNPCDHQRLVDLANMLGTSLNRKSYDLFLKEFAPITHLIFYDDSIATPEGFPDFERTNDSHYPKYCLFRFASFLDLLRPGYIHWRIRAESDSMKWAGVGLRKFQNVDIHERASILSRWIKQPGPAAFSEKRSKKSQEMLSRAAYLLSLSDRLGAELVAKHLDERKPKPPGGTYSSYAEWHQKKPKSFAAWLSKQRKDAMKLLPRAVPKITS